MSEQDPFSPTHSMSGDDPGMYGAYVDESGIRKVHVRPVELMRRSFDLLGDQYWLFLGIILVGMLVGSAVPMGVIMGAMMVGIYLCFIHREQGIQVEWSTLFKGFDYFLESFIAVLVLFAASLLVIVPCVVVMFVVVLLPILANAGNAQQGPPQLPVASLMMMVVLYPLMLIASLLVTLPFMFVFQLIVDRNLKAMDAVRLSWMGVRRNLFGVIWFFVVLMFVSMLLMMMCYLPAIFFMPISFGAIYLLYRDIYGPGIQFATPAE